MSSVIIPNSELFREVIALLHEGQAVTIRANGNSMQPFIRGGADSVILVRSSSGYSRGDIVLARVGSDTYVLHRIYEIYPDNVVLMGDGNCRGTESCRPVDIEGKVAFIVRGGKKHRYGTLPDKVMANIWRHLLPLRRYLLFSFRFCGIYSLRETSK